MEIQDYVNVIMDRKFLFNNIKKRKYHNSHFSDKKTHRDYKSVTVWNLVVYDGLEIYSL